MSTITKERVTGIARGEKCYTHDDVVELARIVLASLEAEAVADVVAWSSPNEERTCDVRLRRHDINPGPLYTAPPVPVSVPDGNGLFPCPFCGGRPEEDAGGCSEYDGHEHQDYSINCKSCGAEVYCAVGSFEKADIPCSCHHSAREVCVEKWNRRAAMLQGADTELQRKAAIHDALCEKYNVESLADFVDWQRNHITELEAAPPAPVGEGETAVMPDYPGYVMTQRECYQAGKKAGLAEAGNSPAHSGCCPAQNCISPEQCGNIPVIPDGWVMVPVEPTEHMIVEGFESEPDEFFSDEEVWNAYDAMSGCQQAAHRAKLCWAAMIASAPKTEA